MEQLTKEQLKYLISLIDPDNGEFSTELYEILIKALNKE